MATNANLLTTSKVTKQTLAKLENNMVIASKADWALEDEFGSKNGQIGDSISIRRPIGGTVRTSLEWSGAVPFEGKILLTINQPAGIDLKFSDEDMTLKVEDFSKRYIDKDANVLANYFDGYVYDLVMKNAYNTVGQYGVAITSDTVLAAREKLMTFGCPDDGEIYGVLTQKHNRNLVGAQSTLFNAQKEISDMYKKGFMGEYAGISFAASNSSPKRVDGTVWTGNVGSVVVSAQSPLTSGWADTGTISVAGFTAGRTLKAGDVFTLSGAAGTVKYYNELTKTETEYDMQFVVLEDVASSTSAAQSVKIAPALIVSGDYKNVGGNLNASVSLIVHSESGKTEGTESIIFHKQAIKLASPKLVIPGNKDEGTQERGESGINIRYLRAYAPFGAGASTMPFFGARLDTIFGGVLARREWCIRIR